MNERIQELAEQAEMAANKGDHVDVKIMMEKFVELIVRECADIVADAVDHREPASTYVDKIKQHFGVE
jgi:hypothetical protein